MHSLRSRIAVMTVVMILISVTAVTTVSVLFIRRSEHFDSEQLLLLLCETGRSNLNYYFDGVQKSVGKIASFVVNDLEDTGPEDLSSHVERVQRVFDEQAHRTSGVLTYYYRIDPAVSDTVKGFWYTNLDGSEFVYHEVTDITRYDTDDTSRLVWFTVPKSTGKPVWLSPYITDNLDMRVISYNVPIYWNRTFLGVVGIEIDYSSMASLVESIRLYKNGYAFLCDAKGNIVFHPRIDVTQLTSETMPQVPEGLLKNNTFISYSFDGEQKEAAWLELSNGMRLIVSVPIVETEGDWARLVIQICGISLIILISLCLFTLFYTGHITRPLQQLTEAAGQLDRGNYEVNLDYDADDEVGRLTRTFRDLSAHMKSHIQELKKRATIDALTSVKNKGAFSTDLELLEKHVAQNKSPGFAMGVFDCDNLKMINDQFGHEKGDLFLKTSCQMICQVFKHSPVYRIGGDEFVVILRDHDYDHREELENLFRRRIREACTSTSRIWEQPRISVGIAEYDPAVDRSASETLRRADRIMYADKRQHKSSQKP